MVTVKKISDAKWGVINYELNDEENSKKIENNMKIITLEDMLLSKIPVFLSSSTQDFTVSWPFFC